MRINLLNNLPGVKFALNILVSCVTNQENMGILRFFCPVIIYLPIIILEEHQLLK
jgi:hypothetical protein